MRALCFIAVLLSVGLTRAGTATAQETDTPVFRSDTNAVSFEFGAGRRTARDGKSEPLTTLTIGDMKVVIDRQEYPPTTMAQDKPGHYVLSLILPDKYRDGKTHKVRFKVKKSVFPFTRTITLPKV